MKRNALFIAILYAAGLTAPVQAGTYPTEGGNLRRENHNISPSTVGGPLVRKWFSRPCTEIGVPVGGPIVLESHVLQAYKHGIVCRERGTGAVLWNYLTGYQIEIYATPMFDPDHNLIYVGTLQGDTFALNPSTGALVWFYGHDTSMDIVPSWNYWQYASPLYTENRIFVGTGGAGFRCLNADTRDTIWNFDFSSYFGGTHPAGICTPAFDSGKLYLSTTDGDLFCLDSNDGSVVWHVQVPGLRQNGLLLTDDYVFTTILGGGIQCRRKSNGSLVWQELLTGMTSGNLAICGDLLIVPGIDWRIWAVDVNTGHQVWNNMLAGNFARSSPFVICGKVFISACHGDFYGLDGQTGQVEWRYHNAAEHSFVDWAADGEQVFVADSLGRMYCFGPKTPKDPSLCLCNLKALWTPEPTAIWTPTPTQTPIPTNDWNGTCQHTLRRASSPLDAKVFFDPSNAAPVNDASGNNWMAPLYQETSPWRAASAVAQNPGDWTIPCQVAGTNNTWIAAYPSALPPTTADAYFRSTLPLPADATVSSTSLILSGDKIVDAYLNGHSLGHFEGDDENPLYMGCVTVTVDPSFYQTGANALAFRLINPENFHGLTFEWCVTYSEPCTATLTPTVTGTATSSPTLTPTPVGTWSPIPTSTPTLTDTETPTLTLTKTSTTTETRSPTLTFTPTPTFTITDTSTPTQTPTVTTTPTETATSTPTSSATSSPTLTPTPVGTWSPIPTSSYTSTPTLKNTETPTLSPTRTSTATETCSPTITASPTFTITDTSTPTQTPTSTTTPTENTTSTFTSTATPTTTLSPTKSPTYTSTITTTATTTRTPIHSICHKPCNPNPCQDKVTFHASGNQNATVQCRVFSTASRLLYEKSCRMPSDGNLLWDLKDKTGRPLANGLYLAVITVEDSNGKRENIDKLIILR